MYSVYDNRLLTYWIAPFRHLRINARLQLPEAYRSLPRLSSALSAKAFTLCSCSLDHYVISWFSLLIFGNCSLLPKSIYLKNLNLKLLFASIAVSFIVQFSMCSRKLLACLVGSSGLEPPTSRLSGVRSNHLSYEPIYLKAFAFYSIGGDEQNRTVDPLLARQVLSQLSYTPIVLSTDLQN